MIKYLLGAENKLKWWKEYIKDRFRDDRADLPPQPQEINEHGLQIIKDWALTISTPKLSSSLHLMG